LKKRRQNKVRRDFSEENILKVLEHSHPKPLSLQENLSAALPLESRMILSEADTGSGDSCGLQRSPSCCEAFRKQEKGGN